MVVGENVLRKEEYEKLTGAARYVHDIEFEGRPSDTTIRIYIQHGQIKMITLVPRLLNES
jgi:CO/xanthine dehydrogenase Mo-binding subunit